MSNELFVDGICEIDDKTIGSYFSRFGSRITHYESHRHRPTNSCCFALISFESHYTVNAILRQRPHSINFHSLFVKRVLPPGTCSFIERLLPVSSLFVYNKLNKEFDEQKLRNYFSTFGQICKFERDYNHDRLFIEYNDYDSVDKIFLNKNHLPNNIDIHKNILPRAQNTIEYHGTCRRKQQEITIEEKKKKRNHKKKSHTDEQYQDLLQKTIGNLINCKAQLRNTENDYVILQMSKIDFIEYYQRLIFFFLFIEYTSIKEENDKLNQLLDNQNKIINSCLMCQEHEITIARLQQTLLKLNEQYDTIKSQYQRLLSTQQTPIILSKPGKYNY
jgi:RNA recognition motif-containing protein